MRFKKCGKGCSRPTICETHGCAAVEGRRNAKNPYHGWSYGQLMAELQRRDAEVSAILHRTT